MKKNRPPNEYLLSFDFSLDRLDVGLQAPDGSWLFHQSLRQQLPWLPSSQTGGHLLPDSSRPPPPHRRRRIHPVLGRTCPGPTGTGYRTSAGVYWWHAFFHIVNDPDFAPLNPSLALLNPTHVKHFRKSLPQHDKSDPDDVPLIAHYYRNSGVKHFFTFDERYLPLRLLSRAYCRLTHNLAAEKAFCLCTLYLFASDYQRLKPFSDNFGATSSFILTEYPDVATIADIPLQNLSDLLDARARRQLKDPQDSARKLHQVAQDSYPFPPSLTPTVHTVMRLTLQHIHFLEKQKAAFESSIQAQLTRLPEANPALAIKGLGPLLVSGCLAEIRDTRRFITGPKYDRKRKCWRQRKYRDGQAAVARATTPDALRVKTAVWLASVIPTCAIGSSRLATA
jgi:hypothetical protein